MSGNIHEHLPVRYREQQHLRVEQMLCLFRIIMPQPYTYLLHEAIYLLIRAVPVDVQRSVQPAYIILLFRQLFQAFGMISIYILQAYQRIQVKSHHLRVTAIRDREEAVTRILRQQDPVQRVGHLHGLVLQLYRNGWRSLP